MEYLLSEETLRINSLSVGGAKLINKMKDDVEWFEKNFNDDASVTSGWGHVYFCSEDGAFLNYNLKTPKSHVCPICGKDFTDEQYNAAWVYFYRYDAIMSAWEAATLYKLYKDKHYLEHFKKIIGFYSDHYAEFEVHGRGPSTSGNGKITPQALNEAIFLVRTVNALELLKHELSEKFIEDVSTKLLIPGAEFINDQKKIINNIPCWINSAVGVVGLFTNNKELVDLAFDAPLGLSDQVSQGVTKSYFWFEGSIHYNCFTLEAFLNQMLFAKIYGKTVPKNTEDTIYKMVLAPFKMSFSNGVLPNPNDRWPNLGLKTYSYLFEIAAKVFKSDEIRSILSTIYKLKVKRVSVPMSSPIYCEDYCLEYMLFSDKTNIVTSIDFWKQSYDFEASNYAMLRKANTEAFIKYGHCTKSHAHPDKMNLEITAYGKTVSRDLSNCGYAAKLCNEFYRTSVSHNTVVLDGKSQPGTEKGQCIKYDSNIPMIKVQVKAYPGVEFVREIQITDMGFKDDFKVLSESEHMMDWVFHVEGRLRNIIHTEPVSIGYSDDGYQNLKNVKKIIDQKDELDLIWDFSDGVLGEQKIPIKGMTVYLCDSYDNPVNKMRTTLILRCKTNEIVFHQDWRFKKTGDKDE